MALDVTSPIPTRARSRAEPAARSSPAPTRRSSRPRQSRPKPASAPERSQQQLRPYAGESTVHCGISVLPELWAELGERAGEASRAGARSSASRLLTALLHFHLPSSDAEIGELAQSWERTRAQRFSGKNREQIKLRLYRTLKERLELAGDRAEQVALIRYGEAALVNAILVERMPKSTDDAVGLLHRFELALAGAPVLDLVPAGKDSGQPGDAAEVGER